MYMYIYIIRPDIYSTLWRPYFVLYTLFKYTHTHQDSFFRPDPGASGHQVPGISGYPRRHPAMSYSKLFRMFSPVLLLKPQNTTKLLLFSKHFTGSKYLNE